MAGVVLCVGLTGALVMIGDTVAFVRPAKNIVEQAISIVPSLAYMLLGDRMYADAMAAAVFGGIVLFVGLFGFSLLEKYFFKPAQVKKMEDEREYEEFLLQKEQERRRK